MSDTVTLDLNAVKLLAEGALVEAGCDMANAEAIANVVWMAERDGCSSHGLFRIPGYLASLKSGKVNGKARPKLERTAPSVLWVDGDGGYTPLAHEVMQEDFIELVKAQGLALAAITNTYHFAALWPEVEMLSQHGLVAIACTSYKPVMAPHGGKDPLYGTNPLAFSWPREDGTLVTFDMATAAMARGDIQIRARDGRKLPDGFGVDKTGAPTNDPNAVLDGGAQLPFGGYKGSHLAMMVELLAGPLLGENLSLEAAETDEDGMGPARGGEFLLAFDPAKTRQSSPSGGNAERLFEAMLKQEGVRLPGEGRIRRRADVAENGVRIPKSLLEQIEV
jgi:delta1-piperideine-2-carboxylate reductase